jgi:hypothetical protein
VRWLSVGALSVVVVGGCGQNAASAPEGGGASPVVPGSSAAGAISPATSSGAAASNAAAGPPFYSVAGGAPEVSGAERVTTGPLASQNGFDHAARFQRGWAYTGRVRLATVDIDRADPDANKCDDIRTIEDGSRTVGHLVVSLQGIGDGGIAILDQKKKGAEGPLVRAHACSGNAIVSVVMRVDGVITNEADLTARSPELISALDEVLDDLRPR